MERAVREICLMIHCDCAAAPSRSCRDERKLMGVFCRAFVVVDVVPGDACAWNTQVLVPPVQPATSSVSDSLSYICCVLASYRRGGKSSVVSLGRLWGWTGSLWARHFGVSR